MEHPKPGKLKMPSNRHIERVRRIGTEEKNAELDRQIAGFNEQNIKKKKKVTILKGPIKQRINELERSDKFLKNRLTKEIPPPESVTFDNVKAIFWQYYKQIVYRETNINLKSSSVDEATNEFIKNFLKWLIADKSGEFDISKSLYLWGARGVGKTTIVEVGYYVLAYINHRTKWNARSYKMISMDELFLETYSNESLTNISKLSRGAWCLDELRERHIMYKHYGNEFLIISDILTARHNLWKRDRINTIITTNIPPTKLKEVLNDDRIMDRIQQQYITIELNSSDKRKLEK